MIPLKVGDQRLRRECSNVGSAGVERQDDSTAR